MKPRKNAIDRDGIHKLAADGLTWQEIAVRLGYKLSTISRVLKGRKDVKKPKAKPAFEPWDP